MAAPVTVTLAQQLERQRLELASHQRTDRWMSRVSPLPPRLVPISFAYGHSAMFDLAPIQRHLNSMGELAWALFLYPGDIRRLAVPEAVGL